MKNKRKMKKKKTSAFTSPASSRRGFPESTLLINHLP
jgi:hypothetical protein